MGYAVWPSGRLHLPQPDDPAAVEAVKAAWATVAGMVRRDGPGFDLDEIPPGDTVADVSWVDEIPPGATVADIAEVAAASVTRDGDWLEFAFDEVGDPKWSDQVTAFYVAIAPFVRSGTIQFIGEDESPDWVGRYPDARWSYVYVGGQITQQGWNGWDKVRRAVR